MPGLTLPPLEAARLSQVYFGLPNKVLYAIASPQLRSLLGEPQNRKRWQIGDRMAPDNPYLALKPLRLEDGTWDMQRDPKKILAKPEPEAPRYYTREEIDAEMDWAWLRLEGEMVDILRSGKISRIERRKWERAELNLRGFEALRRMRDQGFGKSNVLNDDEIAGLLDKLDRRIDELARLRFEKLVEANLHAGSDERAGGRMVR